MKNVVRPQHQQPEPPFTPIQQQPQSVYHDENAADALPENDPMIKPPYYETWSHERLVDELLRSYKEYNELYRMKTADAKIFHTIIDLTAQVTTLLLEELKSANDRLGKITATFTEK